METIFQGTEEIQALLSTFTRLFWRVFVVLDSFQGRNTAIIANWHTIKHFLVLQGVEVITK